MNIYITVDTEWDRMGPDRLKTIGTENLSRIPSFHELCREYGIKPIYFCAYEALCDKGFIEYIGPRVRMGEAEIGSHLHPWSTPPFEEEDRISLRFPSELNIRSFEAKLKLLTSKVEEAFGAPPISYRAGRYGFDLSHIPALLEAGYKVGSSTTPGLDWSKVGGPNFLYYDQHDKHVLPGGFTEFPVTIVKDVRRTASNVMRRLIGRPAFLWLRIYPRTKIEDLRHVLLQARLNGTEHLVFIMHSNELHPGCNPYFRSGTEVKGLLSLLKKFFALLSEEGVISKTFARTEARL